MSGVAVEAPAVRVGFIGLGSQGAPMARRIVEAGYPTTLWSRRPQTVDSFRDTPAQFGESPADLAARTDLVCVCVLDDTGVEEVVAGPSGLLEGMAEGGVIAVHSTVHPDTCRRLAERAAERGVTLIDAPVSGGGPAAEQGKLLVMVGGDAETVERVRPVFTTYGDPVVHLGPVGAGQRAKLINNLVLTANLAVVESAYGLARALEVDPARLAVVLRNGSGASFAADLVQGPDHTLAGMARAAPLLQKDARILVELTESVGAAGGIVLQAADAALDGMGQPR